MEVKPFQNSTKEARSFLDPEKLTFGAVEGFHLTATILHFQMQICVLRTIWDVVARVGIWKLLERLHALERCGKLPSCFVMSADSGTCVVA